MDKILLSKKISHALRHEPWAYELELDDDGWVSVAQLINSLRSESQEWHQLQEKDIEEMIEESTKQRHELQNGRIRAIYGHSTPAKLSRIAKEPPKALYHGTSPQVVELIKEAGLQPMNRHNVHLSVDEATALEVGRRKSQSPCLLIVRSLEAFENGVAFYEGNDKVWLADEIPAQFIDF